LRYFCVVHRSLGFLKINFKLGNILSLRTRISKIFSIRYPKGRRLDVEVFKLFKQE
jgi:hypothetical protein